MRLLYHLDRGWTWIRTYLVALALVVAFAEAMVEVYRSEVGPAPQEPPDGYTVERTTATLQWSKGEQTEKLTLQVSIDDPSFQNPVLDKKTAGKTHSIKDLKRGHTYYWRLIGDKVKSPVAKFKTSEYAIDI